ncbi:MAG: PSD1 domain-containing protein [Planctomycetes bacterium]|nr:PSD1 domain-containing protein [Planctomycetota bacterium]
MRVLAATIGLLITAPLRAGDLVYDRDVRPILAVHCLRCHSGPDAKSDLRLDDRSSLVAPRGESAAAVVPGSTAHGLLLERVRSTGDDRMPPKGPPLDTAQVATLERWIAEGATFASSDADGIHWHWAYRPIVRAEPPTVARVAWPRNDVDRFVLAGIEAAGLEPAPEADRATLARRLALDLTGLPPTIEALDAFLADAREDAYELYVDALLQSPAYAEHLARIWLDLAHYADTNGYEKDGRRSAWPWRNAVIDAFDRDQPFDVFTRKQLAGDLEPDATAEDRIATGFLRNTMTNEEGGVDPEEFRVEAVFDRLDTVSTVWLGSTLECARCHDHKYDPFTQRDYFRFLAYLDQDEPDTTPTLHGSLAAGAMETVAGPPAADGTATTATTLVMKKSATPRTTHVFAGGSFLAPREAVDAGVPAFLPQPLAGGGDRAALAAWLTDPKNPLPPRVFANRLFALAFAKPLVSTLDDFGTQGEPPTHPELLDWLASEFVRDGQSIKRFLKMLVTSSTYRQSANADAATLAKDPGNRLLARAQRVRVEAEVVRDVALAAAGILSAKRGGPSVFPPQPDGIWTMIYNDDRWVESAGEDRRRRGLYTFWRRTAPYPTFMTFDAPSRETCVAVRPRSNTPLQALVLLNDPAFVEAQHALAQRMTERPGLGDAERVVVGFRRVTARVPEPIELETLLGLLAEQRAAHPDAEDAAWRAVASVLLNLDETITRS